MGETERYVRVRRRRPALRADDLHGFRPPVLRGPAGPPQRDSTSRTAPTSTSAAPRYEATSS